VFATIGFSICVNKDSTALYTIMPCNVQEPRESHRVDNIFVGNYWLVLPTLAIPAGGTLATEIFLNSL